MAPLRVFEQHFAKLSVSPQGLLKLQMLDPLSGSATNCTESYCTLLQTLAVAVRCKESYTIQQLVGNFGPL